MSNNRARCRFLVKAALAVLGVVALRIPARGQLDTFSIPQSAIVNGTIQPSTASINFTYLSSSTMVSGFGISFTANNVIPGGSTVTLTSSQQIQVMGMQALGGDVSFDMAPAGGGGIATLTFSGLKPNATYYYRPTGGQETPYVADPGGTLSVLQDISEPRHVVLLAHKGTIFINGDGSVSPATALASISVNGDMYTLTQDLHETLVIERSGATLDGKGHAIDGAGTGAYGGIAIAGQPLPIGCPSGPPGTPFFYFNGSCNITVRNVVVKNFPVGIQMSMTANASVIHSTITNNSIGLIVNAEYGATVSSNVFINNTSEDLRLGFNINNVYVGNVIGSSANVNTVGMHVYPSGDPAFYNHDNIFQGNTILGELHGFSIQEALGFKFIGNTVDARSIPYLIPPALGVGFFFTRSANYTGQQIALSSNTFYVNTQGASGIAILTDQGLGNRFEYNAIPYPGIGIFLMGPTNPAFPVGSDQIVSNSVVGYPTYAFDVINVPGVALTNNTASAFNVGILGGSVISSNIVTGLYAGIQAPGGATVSYNTISAQYGTALSATNDVIHDNLIADSKVGIDVGGGNQIYHNDFVRNKTQVNSQATAPNTWNLPWPVGGNYFDDYTAPDNFYGTSQGTPGSDRVVDAPRVFNAGNRDNFPFTLPDRWQVPDRMPPNPITDLTVTPGLSPSEVFLSWTVPGDPDGIGDPARSYDIRFGPNPITSPAVFDSLPQRPLIQDSTPVGSRTGYAITPQAGGNYVAVKALDEPAHNASALSNMGGQINYLSLSVDSKVKVIAGVPLNITNYPAASPVVSGALAIATSLGLTLVSNNVYDLSPVAAFSPAASLSFAYDPAVVTNPSAIAVYRYDGTTWQTGPATGITNQVVDTANSRITANIAHTSLWALFTKASDVLPPRTALNVGQPRHGTTPVLINTFTPLSFSAADDFRVVGDSAGVGVAATYYAVDGSTFSLYASSFTIPVEGFHSIRFYSVDKAGNQETVNISTVGVDHTPPITQVVAGSPVFYAVDGSTYVSPASSIGLSVVDPAVGGVAAGPQVTFYTLDGGGLTQYSSSFTLAEGAHSLTFQSGDWVGNIENPKTATLKADGTPPSTQLVIQGTQTVSGGVVYVSPGAVFSFAAQDPVSRGVASGVGRTLYSVDGGAPGAFLAAFTLSTGAHALAYQSVDNVGNVETLRVSSFTIRPNDLLPPRTTLLVGRPAYGALPLLVTSATPFGLGAVDDALTVGDGAGGGVARSYYAIDGGAFLAFSSSFAISGAGSHLIRYYSVDLVGNAEAVRSSTVAVDDAPPETSLAISTPPYAGYVSSSAVFSLSAVDPLVSGVASGVAGTFVSLGTAPAAAYAGPFTLAGPEGAKTISYHSVDNLSNAEVVHSTTVLLDATPPVTVVSIGASSFTASGAIYVAATTPVSFTAADPPLASGVSGSGVARVLVSVDGGPYATVTAPLNFAEGLHSILYQAVDNVGNVEPLRALTLRSDGTPPATAFAPSGAFFSAGARNYAPASFFYVLSAADPVSNSVASGLASTRYALDGGAFQTYASTFSLAEGVRQVVFQSQDNVGNLEPAKSATVYVDATAPVTSLLIAGGRKFSGPDGVYVSADARLALAALDPGAPGAASGVALTRWQDNGGAFQVYGTSIALNEGAHVVAYQSQDNVQNLEVLRSTVVFVDATAPNSAAGVGAPSYTAADGTLYIGTATLVSIAASDPALPGGHSGSGVARIEVSVDSAAYGAYSAPLTFAAGRHSLLYRAVDQTGNVEPAHALAVSVDATAPVTTLAVSTPNSGGFVSAATLFSLSAVDPAVDGVASGVAATRYSLDGGAFAAYAAPFGLVGADGPHVIAYLSADNLGNTESVRSATFQLDQTPPVAAAHVGAPSYTASDGTLYVTPATPVTFTAADAASGVDRIEVAVDGGSYSAYASALTFAEGRHAVLYRAVDKVGNVAPARTLSLRSDATPPMTALSPSGAFFTANSRDYASAGFFYTLTANDPASNNVASGLAFTRYALDGGAFQTYVSTFGLVEGVRQVAFQSSDNVGNQELLKSATVYVDATPPVTALTIGQPQYQAPGGLLFVGPAATFALSAQDPVVQGVASGVSAVSARVDAGAYSPYGASFTLTPGDGLRTVGWFAVDNVGNAETPKISTVALDATAPLTSLLVVGGRQFPGPNAAAFYASSDTRLALPAVDPVVNGAASGVAFTQYQDNGGAFQAFAAPFGLPEGAHALGYQSQDRVANLEVLRSTTVLIDAAPPVTTAHIVTPLFVAPDGTNYVTPATPVTFTAADPALAGTATPGSGVNHIEVAIDGGAFALYSAALTFAEGRHTILFRSIDNVGNVEAAQTLSIRSDNTSPMTALAVVGGKQAASAAANSFYASADSRFGLPAVDPIVNGVASGVAFTRYQDNGGAFQTFTAAVALTEGSHLFAYQSQDNVGNVEVLRSTTILVDATPPVSTAAIGLPLFVAADGTNYITPATPVTLSAFDPAVSGLASGVDRIEVNIDGAGYAAYSSTLTFAEGRHTVLFRAFDRVGNKEAAHTLLLQSDNTPPITAIQPSGTLFTVAAPEGPRSYAPAQFTYSLPATDPVVSGVASGVAFTRYRVGSAFQPFVASFSLSEGIRRVDFQSQDNVGNLELLKSATIFIDATPPVTALAIGGPKSDPGNGQTVFISAQTPLSLSAVDPLVQEVASGVSSIFFRRNADPFAAYASSFTLPLPDGFKTVAWYAVDNVGNQELAKATTVFLDNTPPQTGLAVVGGHQFPGTDAITFYASADTRLALPAVDPIVGGAASGLAVTQYQDNGGAFQTFVAPFGLAEGAHALGYRSQDRVQNMEVLRSTNVWVDAAPPVSSFAFGAPYYQAPDGKNYITPATPVTFTAADPALPSGQPGSGVNRIEVAVDGAPFAVYTASLTFAEGRHTILYRSIDNVANVEATRTLNIQSDATPPVTALAVLGGHQFQGPDAASFFASVDTRYSLPAVDPLVKNVASGVAFTRWQDNGGAFQPFGSALALAEGVHHLVYQSQDNVSNLEVPRSTTALVDATPPLTSLLVSGGRQFAGPDASTFYASADTRLVLVSTDPAVNGVASGVAFTRWQDNSGAFTTYISSLALAEGAHKLGYQSQDNVANLEVLRSTNAWIDATPPATTVSVGSPTFTAVDGTIYVATATPVTFAAADPNLPTGQSGSGLNHIETSLDGAPFAPYAAPLRLAEGRHVILYRAVDNVGNVESAHSISIQSDATPPASALVIGAPQFQLPNALLVSSRTPFSIAAVDPVTNNVASGVKDTYYRVSDVSPSTAAFAAFAAPFSLSGADVSKVVEFFSRDNVLNAEVVKSSTVLLDSTPPEVVLLSPATCDSGICRVLKGKFPVLGTARDLHFGNYILDYAPGQNAAAGFTFISSGTAAVNSGALGTWDTSALNGWQTLRLTATDLVANVSVLTINVFVGDPGELLTLGNHEVFDMPEGVAVGADGKIYVADRDNSRIAVFSSTGSLLASFGSRGHDDDDHRLSTGTLRLHEPSGVAVDAAGNIYVADTDRDRVLKLSATGQILLNLGRPESEHEERRDDHDDDHNPRLPGRFHHPAGVAVDASQNIFVADTDNRRVQVFNSTGGFTLQFDLPPVPVRPDRDEDDHDGDAAVAALGRPFGIALDAAGNIYVADPRGGRALKFGATGQFLLTVPITGDRPGSIGRPFGVAVSASGDCLLVSDRKYSRILKFDFQGSQNLVFGAKGKVHDDDAPAPSGAIVFNKPMGLALDAQGNLFVADRNNDRVRKFALPTGQPPLVVPTPKPEDEHVARDVVDKEDGGKVERKDLAAVDIPAGAVAQDMKVTVSTPTEGAADESNRRRAVDAAQLKTASPPVEYGPEGTKFAAPVTLTLPYSPDLVALEGVDEADLTVRYWNRDKAQWENLDSVVDPKTHTVKAKTSHFSLYQIFSGTASAVGLRPLAVGDPTFMFHDAYAFPNPVRGVNAATIRIQPGLADSVEVHVYDLAGRRVYSSSNFSLNTGLDDGNGKGVQYTYDNVWDISGVGSGVYQYVLTAKKSGQTDIHKAGRIAVVK